MAIFPGLIERAVLDPVKALAGRKCRWPLCVCGVRCGVARVVAAQGWGCVWLCVRVPAGTEDQGVPHAPSPRGRTRESGAEAPERYTSGQQPKYRGGRL